VTHSSKPGGDCNERWVVVDNRSDNDAREAHLDGCPQSPPLRNGLGAVWQKFTSGGWYLLIVIATIGILSAVPFGHAARLRKPALWAWSAGYAIAAFMLLVLTPSTPRNAAGHPVQSADSGSPVIAFLALAMAVVACLHLRSVRRRVYGLPDPVRAPVGVHSSDPAITAALAARSRRDEARRLAEADPLLARELRIGRPDLPRPYDYGGLGGRPERPPRGRSASTVLRPRSSCA
jgi:hypothetical protein